MRQITFLCIFGIIAIARATRILIIPMQGKSHMIATNAIGQELKKNGHEVRIYRFKKNVSKSTLETSAKYVYISRPVGDDDGLRIII